MPFKETPDGGIPFGEPRPVVQKRCGLEERRGVDANRFARQTLGEVRIAGPVGLIDVRQLAGIEKPVSSCICIESPERDATRIRIRFIEAARDPRDGARIADARCEHRHAVEGAACRDHTPGRPPAPGGLESHEFVEGGRNTPRPGRIRTQRERNQAEFHGDGGPAAAAAGDVIRSECVDDDAVGRPRAYQSRRELVHICLAHRNRAGGNQALHHGRGSCRRVGVVGTPGGCRHPGEIDVVLDSERHPPKW